MQQSGGTHIRMLVGVLQSGGTHIRMLVGVLQNGGWHAFDRFAAGRLFIRFVSRLASIHVATLIAYSSYHKTRG